MIVQNLDDAHEADVVIIGSGPGGSVMAATLAEAGKSVLLIEEGSNRPQASHVPFSFAEMRDKYRNGGMTVAFGKPDVAYAEGSCVGGGSEVNSGLYHRTPEAIIDEWQNTYALQNFTAHELERWFDLCENVMQPATYPDTLPTASQTLRRGAEQLGWQSSDIPRLVKFNDARDQQNAHTSHRNSMTETFIPLFHKHNGRLLADTRVSKLQRKNDGSWDVHALHMGHQTITIRAKTVFVCAGAINTPALLRRSGIKHNVGNTLTLQPMSKVTAVFNEAVNFAGMGIAAEQVKQFSPDYSFGCSISSTAHLAVNLLATEDGSKTVVEQHNNMLSYYVMARGGTAGSVRNIPGFKSPLVRYQMSAAELHHLATGSRDLSRLMFEAGATKVYTGVTEKPVALNSTELRAMPDTLMPNSANIMTVHAMGSCPIGENRSLTAANSFGQIHDYNNLYIADASMLCNSLAVNPQGSIMAIARRNADHFLNATRL